MFRRKGEREIEETHKCSRGREDAQSTARRPRARLHYSNVEQISVVDIAIRPSKYPIDRSLQPSFRATVLPSPLAPLAYPSALLPSSSAVGNSVFSPRLPPGPSISVSCTHRGPLSRTPALTRDNEPTPTHVRIGEYVQCRSFPAETLLRLLFSSRQLYSVNRAPMLRLVGESADSHYCEKLTIRRTYCGPHGASGTP